MGTLRLTPRRLAALLVTIGLTASAVLVSTQLDRTPRPLDATSTTLVPALPFSPCAGSNGELAKVLAVIEPHALKVTLAADPEQKVHLVRLPGAAARDPRNPSYQDALALTTRMVAAETVALSACEVRESELLADVVLNGQSLSFALVSEGLAEACGGPTPSLCEEESAARREARGMWAAWCRGRSRFLIPPSGAPQLQAYLQISHEPVERAGTFAETVQAARSGGFWGDWIRYILVTPHAEVTFFTPEMFYQAFPTFESRPDRKALGDKREPLRRIAAGEADKCMTLFINAPENQDIRFIVQAGSH